MKRPHWNPIFCKINKHQQKLKKKRKKSDYKWGKRSTTYITKKGLLSRIPEKSKQINTKRKKHHTEIMDKRH